MRVRKIWRKLVGWGVTKKKLKWTAVYLVLKWTVIPLLVAYLIRIEKWRHYYWLAFPILAVAMFLLFGKKKKRATK